MTMAGAAGTAAVFFLTYSISFFLPASSAMPYLKTIFLSVTVPNVGIPILMAIIVRRPWWLRWTFLGFALFNVGYIAWLYVDIGPDALAG